MNFLIIDTSGFESFVSLCDEMTCKTELLPPLKQSLTLLPAIEKLCAGQTLDFVAIGTGPGSFTGTRVGVITAKTLAFALKIPLVSFCSLKIYTPDREGPFVLHGDAKSSGTFALKGVRTAETAFFEAPYIKEEKHPLSKGLNLPFLRKYLLEKFLEFGGTPEGKITVCYLKNS